MPHIAIIGVGAIGGSIAAQLHASAHHHITLCTRRPLNALYVETPTGMVSVPPINLTDPSTPTTPVDWILVATKTYDIPSAAAWLPALLGPQTRLAVLQNGVEHRENFAPFLPAGRLLPVVIDCPAERRPDATILQRGPARMLVEDTPDGHDFAALFHHAPNATVQSTPDLLSAAWRKLCINSAGAVSALVLKPAGCLHDPALGQLALDIIAECIAVGRAEGAHLEDSIAETVLAGYRSGPPDSVNSILADRLAGRPMEVEARNGVIVRKGILHGIPTPCNKMAAALLHAMSETAATPA